MGDAENAIGQVILWAARLVGVLLIYLVVRYFKPTIFYKGWNNLQTEYRLTNAALPTGLVMQPTSLRIGSEHYNQTARIGLGATGVYLQQPFASKGTLYLPYDRLKLVSPPGRTGMLNSPVYGIFKVNGIDVWIDSPYAEQIINHLPTP